MISFFKTKKKLNFTDKTLERIKSEVDLLKTTQLLEGIFYKTKEFEFAYYLNIIIDKRILGIDNIDSDHNVPDYITFLIILDVSYPDYPPKILAKTNVSYLYHYIITII